jgi:hypothetical protein
MRSKVAFGFGIDRAGSAPDRKYRQISAWEKLG